MVEEQACIQVTGQIDLEQIAVLAHLGDVGAPARVAILAAALVAAAHLENTWSGRTPSTTGASASTSS